MTDEPLRVHSPAEDSEYYFDEGCFILETWNDPADEAVSIARARVTPGVTTRLHRLHDTIERYVILSGRGIIGIAPQPPRQVYAGDVVIIPAGHPQRIHNPDPQQDLVFLAICTPRFVPESYEDIDSVPYDHA